jgi:hypothetical protein
MTAVLMVLNPTIVNSIADPQSNRQSPVRIDNPQSSVDNRQSPIFNRQ